MKCTQCGNEIEGKFCSTCGKPAENIIYQQAPQQTGYYSNEQQPKKKKKEKKPIYKKWWFIALAVIAVLVIVGKIFGGEKAVKIEWSEMELGYLLPEPENNKGIIHTNTDEELWVEIVKTEKSSFKKYYGDCEEKGFSVEEQVSSEEFNAFNNDGYKLQVSFFDDKMTIQLEAPEEFSNIQWPTSTAGTQLPTPKSLYGAFSFENENSFYVKIGNTTLDDYNNYVTECANKGFTVEYNKGDNYYYADNKLGYHLSLNYEGNSIMSIRIDLDDVEDEVTVVKEESSNNEETTETKSEKSKSQSTNGISSEFKEAMDSYEKFMDEYVSFMKKYANSNGKDLSLISDYSEYMKKYFEMVEDFEDWKVEDLSTEELSYYIDVQTRVSKKLLEVSGV